MAKYQVITEDMIEAALRLLEKRISEPPPVRMKNYSRREAFLKLRARTKEALAAGHSLETVLDDLKGVGIGLTIATAYQYLKPCRKTKRIATRPSNLAVTAKERAVVKPNHASSTEPVIAKGTFEVIPDEKEI